MIARAQVIAALRARLEPIRGTTLNTSSALATDGPVDVADGGQEIVEADAQVTRYSLALDLSAAVSGADDDAASTARDELYAECIRRIFADPPQLGLPFVDAITEGSLRNEIAENASSPVLGFTLEIDVQFFNRSNDPGVTA